MRSCFGVRLRFMVRCSPIVEPVLEPDAVGSCSVRNGACPSVGDFFARSVHQTRVHQPQKRLTNFCHQSCGKAPLHQPQDFRLGRRLAIPPATRPTTRPGRSARNERGGFIRTCRLQRTNGPRLRPRSNAALHSPQTGRTRTTGLIVRDEIPTRAEPQNRRQNC